MTSQLVQPVSNPILPKKSFLAAARCGLNAAVASSAASSKQPQPPPQKAASESNNNNNRSTGGGSNRLVLDRADLDPDWRSGGSGADSGCGNASPVLPNRQQRADQDPDWRNHPNGNETTNGSSSWRSSATTNAAQSKKHFHAPGIMDYLLHHKQLKSSLHFRLM